MIAVDVRGRSDWGKGGAHVLSGGTLPFLAFLHAPQARIEGITQGVSQIGSCFRTTWMVSAGTKAPALVLGQDAGPEAATL